MKSFIYNIAFILLALFAKNASSADICNLDLFNESELAEPYKGAHRILQTYNESDSQKIVQEIVRYSIKESNRNNILCTGKSASCSGLEKDWWYSTEKIFDNFGNLLRINSNKALNSPKVWPYHGSEKSTTLGFSCSSGGIGNLKSQCVQWCSLKDVTVVPGD
jgi:hypothetical protein